MTTPRDQADLQNIAQSIAGAGARVRDPERFRQYLSEKDAEFHQQQATQITQQLATQEAGAAFSAGIPQQPVGDASRTLVSQAEPSGPQLFTPLIDPEAAEAFGRQAPGIAGDIAGPVLGAASQLTSPADIALILGTAGLGAPAAAAIRGIPRVGRFAAPLVEPFGGGFGRAAAAEAAVGTGAILGAEQGAELGGTAGAIVGGLAGGAATLAAPAAGRRAIGGALRAGEQAAEAIGRTGVGNVLDPVPPRTAAARAAGDVDPEDAARAAGDAVEAEVAAIRAQRDPSIPAEVDSEIAGARSRLSESRATSESKRTPLARTPQEVADQRLVGEDSVSKLTNLVRGFREIEPNLRSQLEAERRVERGRRVGIGVARQADVSPTEARQQFLSAQGGELPAVPRFEEIRSQFGQDELDNLYGKIWREENTLRPFERSNADGALTKLLSGEPPTPAELRLLENVFGRDLVRAIDEMTKSRGRRAFELFQDFAGLFRSLRSSFDISAVVRQGGVLSFSHPKKAFFGRNSSTWRMLRAFGSEDAARESIDRIRQDPDIAIFTDTSLDNPLFIRDPFETDVLAREEAFISRFSERIPGIQQSGRAFSTYLNEMTTKVAKDFLAGLRSQGIDPSSPEAREAIERMSRFLNVSTGRGSLGSIAERSRLIRDIANTAFWSPRLVASRIQTPIEAGRAIRNINADDPAIRAASRQIARDAVTYTGSMISFLTLLDLSGLAEVEIDPRSSDFGKIQVGSTRVDTWGGFQQVARYITQLITGQRTAATTGNVSGVDRDQVLGQFIRSKLAPGPVSLGATFAPQDSLLPSVTGGGRTFVGERIEPGPAEPREGERTIQLEDLLAREVVPLIVLDVEEAIKEDGLTGGVLGLSALVGTGVTSFRDADETRLDEPAERQNTQNVFEEFLQR